MFTELAIVIISVVASFIPYIADDLENKYLRDKKNISQGQIYSMIDEALTAISAKGQVTAQKFLNKLTTSLMSMNMAGSQAYIDYINKARKKKLAKQEKINSKMIEASISEQAANTLANAYESMSPRNKDSASGEALREGIKKNINSAANAYREIDPDIDLSNLQDVIRKYDAVEIPASDKRRELNEVTKNALENVEKGKLPFRQSIGD